MDSQILECISVLGGFIVGLLFPQLKMASNLFSVGHKVLPEVVDAVKRSQDSMEHK